MAGAVLVVGIQGQQDGPPSLVGRSHVRGWCDAPAGPLVGTGRVGHQMRSPLVPGWILDVARAGPALKSAWQHVGPSEAQTAEANRPPMPKLLAGLEGGHGAPDRLLTREASGLPGDEQPTAKQTSVTLRSPRHSSAIARSMRRVSR